MVISFRRKTTEELQKQKVQLTKIAEERKERDKLKEEVKKLKAEKRGKSVVVGAAKTVGRAVGGAVKETAKHVYAKQPRRTSQSPFGESMYRQPKRAGLTMTQAFSADPFKHIKPEPVKRVVKKQKRRSKRRKTRQKIVYVYK